MSTFHVFLFIAFSFVPSGICMMSGTNPAGDEQPILGQMLGQLGSGAEMRERLCVRAWPLMNIDNARRVAAANSQPVRSALVGLFADATGLYLSI
jgi:hypothetical protein